MFVVKQQTAYGMRISDWSSDVCSSDLHPHDPAPGRYLPPSLLVGLVVAIGLVPALIAQPLIEVVAGAVVGGPLPALHLKLWHGVTPALGMSIIATAGGAFLLWRHDAFNRIRLALPRPEAKTMFDATVGGLAAAANVDRKSTRL